MIERHVRRLRASKLGRQVVGTAFWSLIGEGLSRGLLLISFVIVGRMLGRVSYGEFGLIRTTVLMVASFGGMGLGLMANRFVAQHRERDREFSAELIGASYVLAISAGTILGLAMFLGADYVAVHMVNAPGLAENLRLASVVLIGGAVSGAQSGIMQGLQAYRQLASGNLLQGVIAIVCLIGGAHLGGLNGAIIGFAVHSAASIAIFHFLIRREAANQQIQIAWTRFGRVAPLLWSFCVPLALMSIAVAPFKWFSEAMLAKQMGFGELGTFHAAMTVANALISIGTTLNAPLISVTASIAHGAHSNAVRYVNLYGPWYVFLALALPFLVFPDLAALAFGPSFQTANFHSALLVLLLYSGLLVYYQGVMRIVTLSGSMWFGLSTNIVEGVVLFAAFQWLASSGVIGLALAYLVSYVLRIIVSIPFLLRSGLVPPRLMFDRYFLGTLALLALAVLFQFEPGL